MTEPCAFYVMDRSDPSWAVYRRAFPGVFMDLNRAFGESESAPEVSGGSLFHPGRQYTTFHMTVPQVYYNREDLWVLPEENYAWQGRAMQPYYILMKLPEATSSNTSS